MSREPETVTVELRALREALHLGRAEVRSRGHTWDVADVVAVVVALAHEGRHVRPCRPRGPPG
jgi:hypothetical protein